MYAAGNGVQKEHMAESTPRKEAFEVNKRKHHNKEDMFIEVRS